MLYKKASEMKPTPIPNCMGGEGTVMMERLLDAPAEMLGKGDIIAAMPGDTHQIACLGDEPLVLIAQVLYE